MSIHAWFANRSEHVTANPQVVLDSMSAFGEPIRNRTLWTWAALANRFGRDVVGNISATLDSMPSLKWVNTSLANGGLDFSASEFQSGVDELVTAGVLDKDVGEALKALGMTPRTAWTEATGVAELPTLDAIKEAQAEFRTEQARQAVINWWHSVSAGIVQPAIDGGATIEELKALIAKAE